jgi:MFS family permease
LLKWQGPLVLPIKVILTAILSASWGFRRKWCSTLGDRFGRKRFFLLGLILFVIGSAFCGLASTLGWLLFGRAMQGVGAAALAPGSESGGC